MLTYFECLLIECLFSGLLMAPEPADPLASVLAEEYHTNKAQYEHNAREYTKKYASRVR
jgi:ubiquitin-protein ligase